MRAAYGQSERFAFGLNRRRTVDLKADLLRRAGFVHDLAVDDPALSVDGGESDRCQRL